MSIRLLCAAAAALAFGAAQAQPLQLKVLGQPVGSGLIQKNKEQPFFEKLAAATGLNVSVQYVPVDVAGIPDTDGLRVLRSGLFNIVSIRGPQVSRDEPTILGFDLVGLNPSFETGRKNTAAFFATADKRLQANFNAKLLGVWPAGPQVIFCKPRIKGLADLKGLKVRVGDQNSANFMAGLGATGVPMPFGEVQQALARGVVDCAITGPASANSGGWPEAATTVLPLALQLAVNGYAINLNTWRSTSLSSWRASYEFMANEIYIQAAVDPNTDALSLPTYLAAGPSPDYTTALTPTPPQVPPTGLIQIENSITGGLRALVATGDFKMLPNSSVTQGSVSVQLGAGQTPALPLANRWGYGGNGGDILIDGAINAGSVLLQVNSLNPRRIVTSNTGLITGSGSLNLYNMGADGGSIDVRTADFTSTNIFAGSPLAGGVSGQTTDISVNVNQTRGNLVIDALPASRGAISLKASDTSTIQINANYDSKASLSLEAGTLNVARPISTTSGDITLIAKDTVTVSSNLAAGNSGVGNVVITSTTGNVNLTNSAVVTAPGQAIVLSAPLGLIDSKSRLQAARLEATAATTIVANTAVDVVKAVAGNTITINDIDALTVESMTAKALTVTANGLLTLADLTATAGDITATTAVGGLAARRLETKNGSITLRADAGDAVIDGTVLVGDTGSPRTKDASITASRNLSFWSYQIGEMVGGPELVAHHEIFDLLGYD